MRPCNKHFIVTLWSRINVQLSLSLALVRVYFMQITEQTDSLRPTYVSLPWYLRTRMSANAKFVSLDWKLQHFFTPKFAKIIVLALKSFSRTDFNSLLYGKWNCLYILQQILIMLTWKWGEIISWQMSHCHNVNVSSHLSSCSHSSMTWQWITLRQEIILNITQQAAYFKHRTRHLQSLHVYMYTLTSHAN